MTPNLIYRLTLMLRAKINTRNLRFWGVLRVMCHAKGIHLGKTRVRGNKAEVRHLKKRNRDITWVKCVTALNEQHGTFTIESKKFFDVNAFI